MSKPPTEYLCTIIEVDEHGTESSIGEPLRHRFIARSMDDAVVWLDDHLVDTEGRYFKYEITELQVVG